jgi:AcrR family transcriptional regulator
VLNAAIQLLDQEGREALSLGRLAQRLGIQTPSLYNHIDGLPGLYRALAVWNARTLGDCRWTVTSASID